MRRAAYFLAAVLMGCTTPPPAQVTPVEIAAPFDRTWNAVIDAFAAQNIPIATMEKASGFIATESLSVESTSGSNWAACPGLINFGAQRATYNVIVRSQGTGSTVRVTARWSRSDGTSCSTKGGFEQQMQFRIKTAAEAK